MQQSSNENGQVLSSSDGRQRVVFQQATPLIDQGSPPIELNPPGAIGTRAEGILHKLFNALKNPKASSDPAFYPAQASRYRKILQGSPTPSEKPRLTICAVREAHASKGKARDKDGAVCGAFLCKT